MENLKYSLFDLFSFAIPGSIFLLSLILLDSPDKLCGTWSAAVLQLFTAVNVYAAVAFIVVAYFLGFVLAVPAALLLRFKEWLFRLPKPKHLPDKSRSEKYVLVREHSKENFKYIEQWNVLTKLMSALAVVTLFISITFYVCIPCFPVINMCIGIGLSIAFLFRASEYHSWAVIDLDNAAYALQTAGVVTK